MFSNGLDHGFGPKLDIFLSSFFLSNLGQENVFYDILERQNAFVGLKNKMLKKTKNWDFSKEVSPWFWFKFGHFPSSYFWAI